jgi:alcohol dehydrogenase class IV
VIDNAVRVSFPTTISFGPGAIQQLPEILQELDIHKPLLVTDPILKTREVYTTASAVL